MVRVNRRQGSQQSVLSGSGHGGAVRGGSGPAAIRGFRCANSGNTCPTSLQGGINNFGAAALPAVHSGVPLGTPGYPNSQAGGGVKRGFRYGRTDDYGYFAVENRFTIHDLHATLLHRLGLNHTLLTWPYSGRDLSLTDVYGEAATGILA